MFYCNPCRIYNDWPESLSNSRGNCEICRKDSVCWSRPSSSLPASRAYREYEANKILNMKMYEPKALDIDIFSDVE